MAVVLDGPPIRHNAGDATRTGNLNELHMGSAVSVRLGDKRLMWREQKKKARKNVAS